MNLSITLVQPESFFVQEGYDDIYLLRHVVLLEEDRAYYREYKLGMEVTIRNLLLLGCTRKQITRWATRPATAEEIDLLKDAFVENVERRMADNKAELELLVKYSPRPR